ncbi:S1C family serine protease [Frigoriglobus tundricola]|uniref:HtrA protease/chaperone protein n=1 Tax=Frigoriglobus tundricola TaxID=2774151 RepID=A0A6M5YJ33_9BACT|nr:trypsin-like peptidase domain-containing protein [Frigoriglobus tundricola]QJW93995.1 HtrA protease/chaperone protein [Frigoriglobus tundricola]
MSDYDYTPRRRRDEDDDDDRPVRRRFRPEERPGRGPAYYALFVVLGVVIGGLVLWGVIGLAKFRGTRPGLDPSAQPRETTPGAPLDAEEQEAVTLFERVRDSVVNVDVVLVRQGRLDEQPTEQQTSGGSGFVWDAEGRIVTNYHVVADVTKRPDVTQLRVVLADRSAYTAQLLGTAPDSDLAVVQISAPKDKLKPIAVGTSADLKVGQKAYAIGNPFGLSLTMTKGMVSSLNRIIESPSGARIPKVIQTDAAINPGNSGGPLLDKSGRLIGVNTSIATPNGGNVGIGFAVPVDTVNRVVPELIQSGRSLRPDLGVKLYDERRLRQARYDHGVMIDRVAPNGPAAKAGLRGVQYSSRGVPEQPGDLIVAINGQTVNDMEDYERVLRDLKPGEPVPVKFVRGTKPMELTVTVGGV